MDEDFRLETERLRLQPYRLDGEKIGMLVDREADEKGHTHRVYRIERVTPDRPAAEAAP